jgi:HEXXH motif-containing protein
LTGQPAPHRLPERLLTALAAGGGGPEAVRALAEVQLSRNRLLTRAVVELAFRAGHPDAVPARSAYRLLAEIERAAPAAVAELLRYPTVSAWLSTTAAAMGGPAGAVGAAGAAGGAGAVGDANDPRPARLGLVAAAAAVRAGIGVRLPAGTVEPGPVLILPSLGQAHLPGEDPVDVRAGADGPALARGRRVLRLVPDAGAAGEPSGWTPLPPIRCGADPTWLAASIDGPGWRLIPGGGPDPRIVAEPGAVRTERWRERVAAGWRLLARHHRTVAGEAAAAITALVPLRTPDGNLVSGTFRDGFGAVAMSLPADARSVALTLAHEVQHNKLVGVMDAFPLVKRGTRELFYAPWRTDPRPLGALLHGTYAHVGVAAFWRTQRRVEESPADEFAAQVSFARWRSAAWAATEAVRRTGRLTPVGDLMLDGMRAALREMLAEAVPAEARRRAEELAERHRLQATAGR